jgi:PAS domain S-box-containing protein
MARGPHENTLSKGWSGKSSRTFRKSPAAAVERPTGIIDNASGVQPPELLENLRLQVIELERENQELRFTKANLEVSGSRYFELYDLAPVGCAIIDEQGLILEMNLRATAIFGAARAALHGRNFKFSIFPEDQDNFYLAHKRLIDTGLLQTAELRLYRQGIPFWARLEMILGRTESASVCRIAMVDINDRKIAELQLQERADQLNRSLAEKKILAREVHHRVKNNFQVISSLLRMQAALAKDESVSIILSKVQRRIIAMALIHERLYGEESIEHIDFGEYMHSLIDELFNAYAHSSGAVVKNLNSACVLLNVDQAIPCGLILNELVTNALKYAYPDGKAGEVKIDLKESPSGFVTLTVSDQGVGLPEGVDWNNAHSLGLPLVDALTQQLNGRLTVGPPPGASFTMQFQKQSIITRHPNPSATQRRAR